MKTVLFVSTFLHVTGFGLAQNQFQCQPSTSGSSVYTPNLPDFYFQYQNAAAFSTGVRPNLTDPSPRVTHIFTVPPGSCSGSIVDIEFCYRANLSNGQAGNRQDVFEFMIATITNGNLFTVINRITVQSTPQQSICDIGNLERGRIPYCCCDIQRIELANTEQLQEGFTYAIRILSDAVRPFVFGAFSSSEVEVTQIQTSATGNSFSLGLPFIRPLILIRLIIQPPATTVPLTTQRAITNSPTNIPTPSGSQDTTNVTEGSSSTPAEATTSQEMSMPSSIMLSSATMPSSATMLQDTTISIPTEVTTQQGVNTPMMPASTTGADRAAVNSSNFSPSLLGGSSGAAIVGGAIGGVIVGVLIGMVVIIVSVVAVLKNRRFKAHKNMTLDNAVYGKDVFTAKYAGTGPQASSAVSIIPNENNEDNYYAECGAVSYEMPSQNTIFPYEEPLSTIKRDLTAGTTKYEMPQLSNPVYEEEPGVSWKDEDVYMVPAKDEDTLYAQLQSMLTTNLRRNSIKLGALLGSGQFGMVYKGVLENGEGEGVEVAVKTLKEGSGEEDRVKFLQEAAIMGQFKHHNVVTMYGVITQGEPVMLVLELLSKGDLRHHLLSMKSGSNEENLDDHTLLSYCRQVASGMAYLSSKAFVHRDLAARNILVSDDEICKIADFGMSRDLVEESYYVSHGGKIPVKWTAPEAVYYKKYSTASDVWSYGILMYEIWSVGLKPYQKCDNSKVIKLLDTGYRLPPPPGCPRALYAIMMSCWHPKASERPSFLDLTRQLSLPDPKLLKWSEEDKSVHPEAAQLGAGLQCGEELYKDLQNRYERTK